MSTISSPLFQAEYSRLNLEQKEAVDAIYGPVLVLAGPGSGKTQLLSLRIANILLHTDTSPSQILCLTFTESAARNMKQRLQKILGSEAYKVAVHTFHSFASEIINQNQEYFYFGADFAVADVYNQHKILQEIFEQLDRNDPLSVVHPAQGHIYLNDALALIDALKRSGISPVSYREHLQSTRRDLETLEPHLKEILADKISAKTVENLLKIYPKLLDLIVTYKGKSFIYSQESAIFNQTEFLYQAGHFVLLQLEQSLASCVQGEKLTTIPLTEWKNLFFKKDDSANLRFRDLLKIDKYFTFASMYEQYQSSLYRARLYDFSDMLLEVNLVLSDPKKQSLRYDLQEKFQFVLVDEFQDTNGAQMSLLYNLLNSVQPDDLPNVLLVGDDDQAIYKFQGANMTNINIFLGRFPSTKIVRLVKNYRSTPDILALADSVISKSENRFELHGLKKQLEAVRPPLE